MSGIYEQPPNEVIRAFCALEHDSQFQLIRRWLEDGLSQQDRDNRRATGERLSQGQGSAQALERMLEVGDNARDWLKARASRSR